MLDKTFRAFVTCVFLIVNPGVQADAQKPKPCQFMTVQNYNMIDPPRLTAAVLKGTVQDISHVNIPHACLVVFRESDHEIIAQTESGENGRFSFPKLAPGDYRLIVAANPLCPANRRVRIVKHKWSKRPLIAHMRPRGLDVCSYLDFK
jgi:hypothetical protein